MKKWNFFTIGSGREPITTLAELDDFLAREASLIAQKTIVDYCHMKTRLPLNELMREKAFTEAFDAARGASYAAVLADLVAAVEAHLRGPAGPLRGALPAALARHYVECLQRFAGAAPRDDPAPAGAEMTRRLAQLQLVPPKSSTEIALTCGNAVFDLLPIHPRLRTHDREPVVEAVRFLFMSRCQRLGERLAAAALIEMLLTPRRDLGSAPGSASA
ncbi:MAG: hypothetical protein ACREIP_06720 [Alphaproteobacteria bacterium]